MFDEVLKFGEAADHAYDASIVLYKDSAVIRPGVFYVAALFQLSGSEGKGPTFLGQVFVYVGVGEGALQFASGSKDSFARSVCGELYQNRASVTITLGPYTVGSANFVPFEVDSQLDGGQVQDSVVGGLAIDLRPGVGYPEGIATPILLEFVNGRFGCVKPLVKGGVLELQLEVSRF